MPYIKLKNELEKLRQELNRLAPDDHDTKKRLNNLIADIEKKLERTDDRDHHQSLVNDIKKAISHFETEHPRATAILNDIMVTLSNMGI